MRSSILFLAILLVSGCGSNATGPSPMPTKPTTPSTPTGFSSDQPLSIHLAYLRARSYTPDTRLSISLSGGHRLFAIHSICTGSADGHCQAVDAFLDGQRAPLVHQ